MAKTGSRQMQQTENSPALSVLCKASNGMEHPIEKVKVLKLADDVA